MTKDTRLALSACRAAVVTVLATTVAGVPVYNESVALEYAYLATAAYCGYPRTTQASFEAWNCGPACAAVPDISHVRQVITSDNNDAFGYVARFRGECLVAFRGTSNLEGWLKDLQSLDLVKLSDFGVPCSNGGNPCTVGDGFVTNYFSILGYVRGNLSAIGCGPGSSLTVTGHSLGAAEAIIAAFDLQAQGFVIRQIYTFGQPRVGDATFAAAFDAGVQLNTSFRITYHEDPVVHLPMEWNGFKHIGPEVFYNGPVSQGYILCNVTGEDPKCADRYWDVPGMTLSCISDLSQCDHLLYMTEAKQIPMDGTSCTNGTSSFVV